MSLAAERLWSRGTRPVVAATLGLMTAIAVESFAVTTVLPVVAAELDATAWYSLAFAATITTARSRPASTPSARASSSPSDRTLMRQRSRISGTRPSAISGNAVSASLLRTLARLPSSQNTMAGSWS